MSLDIISRNPREINLEIFSYLDPKDLARCCQMNNLWRDIANAVNNDVLWKRLFPSVYIPEGTSAKNHIISYLKGCTYIAQSEDDVINRIEKFSNRLLLNQRGSFTCLFFYQEYNSIIELEIYDSTTGLLKNNIIKSNYLNELLNRDNKLNGFISSVYKKISGLIYGEHKEVCIFMRTLPKVDRPSIRPIIEEATSLGPKASFSYSLKAGLPCFTPREALRFSNRIKDVLQTTITKKANTF